MAAAKLQKPPKSHAEAEIFIERKGLAHIDARLSADDEDDNLSDNGHLLYQINRIASVMFDGLNKACWSAVATTSPIVKSGRSLPSLDDDCWQLIVPSVYHAMLKGPLPQLLPSVVDPHKNTEDYHACRHSTMPKYLISCLD